MSASPVASITRPLRIAWRAGLAFGDHAFQRPPLEDRRHAKPMQHRLDARFLYQDIGHVFEHLGVPARGSRIAVRAWRRPWPWPAPRTRSRCLRSPPFSRADTQASPSTPTWVMLPPKHPLRSRSTVFAPARAAASAAARTARSAADDENIRLLDHIDGTGRLENGVHEISRVWSKRMGFQDRRRPDEAAEGIRIMAAADDGLVKPDSAPWQRERRRSRRPVRLQRSGCYSKKTRPTRRRRTNMDRSTSCRDAFSSRTA